MGCPKFGTYITTPIYYFGAYLPTPGAAADNHLQTVENYPLRKVARLWQNLNGLMWPYKGGRPPGSRNSCLYGTHIKVQRLRLSGLPREKIPNEACNQNNGVPTLALVRTLLSVRRAENWKTTLLPTL